MNISVKGFSYKQYQKDGEQLERVYETVFDIDVDCIEAIMPCTGPLDAPDDLPYSRIVGKSGRFYDIKLPLEKLRMKIENARKKEHIYKLLIQSQ